MNMKQHLESPLERFIKLTSKVISSPRRETEKHVKHRNGRKKNPHRHR